MIVAIQAGDKDKDPAQTRRHMELLVQDNTSAGDCLLYVDQPSTMMDQARPVAEDLGLDVAEITPSFMLHGTGALGYAWSSLATRADIFLLLSEAGSLSSINREYLSYVTFSGRVCSTKEVSYERTVVL